MASHPTLGQSLEEGMKAPGRRIKCPKNFVKKPGTIGFKVEPSHLNKRFSPGDMKKFGLRNWKYKRDRHGNKIPEWKDYYQPEVGATWCVEHVYDPLNPICKFQCRGRCLEGLGPLAWKGVKRLG